MPYARRGWYLAQPPAPLCFARPPDGQSSLTVPCACTAASNPTDRSHLAELEGLLEIREIDPPTLSVSRASTTPHIRFASRCKGSDRSASFWPFAAIRGRLCGPRHREAPRSELAVQHDPSSFRLS